MKYVINKGFITKNEVVTDRVIKVSEAFGLGVDDVKEFTLFDNFEIEIKEKDIVYITGESGSGKSVALRELGKQMKEQGLKVVNLSEVVDTINQDVAIIDDIGKDLNEALFLLSKAGLSDAFIWLRKYAQLSDGQKYRYAVAKALEQNADVILADEFGAVLDRDTAKIVAYNIQKQIRRLNKIFICATTHTDLIEDLNPSVYIYKKYENGVELQYKPYKEHDFSMAKDMVVEPGDKMDWDMLSKWHYKSHKTGARTHIFRMVNKKTQELVGTIVYGMPPLALAGRNAYTPIYGGKSSREKCQKLNREVRIISRVVVTPKYRSLGLSAKLIKDSLPQTDMRFCELLSVMGNYNKFCEKAGMTKVQYNQKDIFKKLKEFIIEAGYEPGMMASDKYVRDMFLDLQVNNPELFTKIAVENFKRATTGVRGGNIQKSKGLKKEDYERIATMETTLEQHIQYMTKNATSFGEKAYFIWENPDHEFNKNPQLDIEEGIANIPQ